MKKQLKVTALLNILHIRHQKVQIKEDEMGET
jgi:hypothetical protein